MINRSLRCRLGLALLAVLAIFGLICQNLYGNAASISTGKLWPSSIGASEWLKTTTASLVEAANGTVFSGALGGAAWLKSAKNSSFATALHGVLEDSFLSASSEWKVPNTSVVSNITALEPFLQEGGLLVASGAVARSPFKVPDDEPSIWEFAPIYIEEKLMGRSNFRWDVLHKGNWTVQEPEKAIFYVVCCGPIERLLQLPPRSPEAPYLCYDCDAILKMENMAQKKPPAPQRDLLARRDFMFSSTDLRWWSVHNDSSLLMPGVTHVHPMPSPESLVTARVRVNRTNPPKYFLTFQGTQNDCQHGSSYVRHNVEAWFNSSYKSPTFLRGDKGQEVPMPTEKFEPPSDVLVNIHHPKDSLKQSFQYDSLFNSAYGLVLHGHGRWSYRFTETLNGGAIPVLLAEGWRLPLDELVDWEQVTVQRPEAMSRDVPALIESLSRNESIINATHHRIRAVYQKLMVTQEIRLLSLLRSAALWKRNWREREKQTLRMLVDRRPKVPSPWG